MIEVNNISFRYPGTKHNVFSNFNMSLEANNIYGLLGKNGTGKSTLLYLISGLLRPANGEVKVDGRLATDRQPEMLKEMFIVPEEFNLPSVTLDTYVKINKPFYPNFSQEVLESCLKDFELPQTLKLNELSMGQKKKVYMSFALAAGTKYLFMDEPTNGLDIPGKSQFRRLVASQMSDDRTILISTHQVRDIDRCIDHVVIVDKSRVLLDASVASITAKLRFVENGTAADAGEALFSQPSVMGYSLVLPNTGYEETELNLETLFNATLADRDRITGIFNPKNA